MKYVAWLMVLVVIVCGIGVGYLYSTARVEVQVINVTGVPASEQMEYFESLRTRQETGTLEGTVFSNAVMGDAPGYTFLTYTVRVTNQSFLPVDSIEVQLVPTGYDVMQLGDYSVKSLASKGVGDLSATIVTDATAHSVRELVVTYYIWGIPFSTTVTYGY